MDSGFGWRGGEFDLGEVRGELVGGRRVAQAEGGRKAKCQDEADGDRLAVKQAAKPGLAFDRVGEAVAKVEERASSAAVLDVAGNEPCLGGDRGGDRMLACIRIAGEEIAFRPNQPLPDEAG